MCGIAGMYLHRSEAELQRMLAAIRHRGPDEEGTFLGREVAFGHARLSIIDLNGGRQPILGDSGETCIIFNGEIYNHAQLRAELGGTFRTRTDTEVVLRLYEREGPACVSRLDGMFAFAIMDGADLFLARDPLGIKPLYYGHRGACLSFASEAKALQGRVDEICEFPAGHWFHSRLGWERYFELPQPGAHIADWQAGALRDTLEEAVAKRLMADVPVGCFLSGGLDSSTIAALMRRHVRDLHTFAIGTPGSDDLVRAREVAEYLGTTHHEYEVTPEEIRAHLPRIIYHLESFDAALVRSAIPNYFVSRLARQHVKVVLSGEGADELFSGYDYLKRLPMGLPLEVELLAITGALHNTNLQRVDRMTMAHGLEGRVPFLDVAFLRLAFTIPPRDKLRGRRQIEKWALRHAFEGVLPPHILWRRKEKFSRGCGTADIVARQAETEISDAEFAAERSIGLWTRLHSKEELLYYRLFHRHYGENLVPLVGRSRSL
ncbi:MAG: asparagine synthase B [Armatimonadetes bacterium]|nr:asparagine synthase B [Armatimonadota bacterium]